MFMFCICVSNYRIHVCLFKQEVSHERNGIHTTIVNIHTTACIMYRVILQINVILMNMNTAFRLNSDNFSFLFYTCLELDAMVFTQQL
jgi:hypothetical protein